MAEIDDRDNERRLLDAAREMFLDPSYSPLSGVALKATAAHANVAYTSARRCFDSTAELHQALIRDLLTVEEDEVHPDAFVDYTKRIHNVDESLADELGDTVDSIYEYTMANPLTQASFALWPYAAGDVSSPSLVATGNTAAGRMPRPDYKSSVYP